MSCIINCRRLVRVRTSLTAALVAGKNPNHITRDERQEAKAVNFGFLYGMGANGFRAQAKAQYGVDLSQERAEELRAALNSRARVQKSKEENINE